MNTNNETKIVLTLGGYIINDSPVFHSAAEAEAFIRANWTEYAACGYCYL